MSGGFWLNYIFALVVVALLLGGLYAVTRVLARGRLLLSTRKRLVTVLESTPLSQHAAVHVVKVGGRYFLVGGGQAGVNEIAELPADEVESWLERLRAKQP
jgi:flagellar biogenesis protein FliO